MFRKKRTKPCKGETQAVKFQAQVLGRKATLLLRPYRACHCFTAHTQGDALGFHMAPRWGWEGRVRPRRLPVGLEVRHTGGTFSKLTRRAMT